MNRQSFRFKIKEYFKLSTGSTGFVGLLEPSNYSLITNDYMNYLEVYLNNFQGFLHDYYPHSSLLMLFLLYTLDTSDGHHRYRAAKMAGINEIPVKIISDIKNHPSSWNTIEEVINDASLCAPDHLKFKY